MTLKPEVMQAIYDICDIRDAALMCGAMPAALSNFIGEVVDEIWGPFEPKQGRSVMLRVGREPRPYTPRNDPALQKSFMPPEKEWWRLRWSVLRRDEFTCRYCGWEGAEGDGMCADHVVPLSRGGSNDPDNLVACCLPCNSSKSDRLLSEWRGRN